MSEFDLEMAFKAGFVAGLTEAKCMAKGVEPTDSDTYWTHYKQDAAKRGYLPQEPSPQEVVNLLTAPTEPTPQKEPTA